MSPEAIVELPAAAEPAPGGVPSGLPGTVPAPGSSAEGTAHATAPGSTPASASTPAPGGVLGGRDRIDAVDAQIVELIQRRIEVSRQIQAARLADGGRRVDLRRETEIISRYTVGLGRPGTTIAMALLELGRGRA